MPCLNSVDVEEMITGKMPVLEKEEAEAHRVKCENCDKAINQAVEQRRRVEEQAIAAISMRMQGLA